MVTLTFKVSIKADRSAVWQALWSDEGYRTWVAVISEGSHALSEDWKEGSTVRFMGPGGNGMYAIIDRHVPGEKMHFRHQGEVREGVEIAPDPEAEGWLGAMETYDLQGQDGNLELVVSLDSLEEHVDFFNETFPLALEKARELAERN